MKRACFCRRFQAGADGDRVGAAGANGDLAGVDSDPAGVTSDLAGAQVKATPTKQGHFSNLGFTDDNVQEHPPKTNAESGLDRSRDRRVAHGVESTATTFPHSAREENGGVVGRGSSGKYSKRHDGQGSNPVSITSL